MGVLQDLTSLNRVAVIGLFPYRGPVRHNNSFSHLAKFIMEKPNIIEDQNESCKDRQWGCYDQCEVREFGLIRQSDVRGLLHCHTAYGDGDHDLTDIVETALKLGLD